MEAGYLVKNLLKPEYGTGEVVSVEGNYVSVTFENTPETKCFLWEEGPLKIVDNSNWKMKEGKKTKINSSNVTKIEELERRVKRDNKNAGEVTRLAELELKRKRGSREDVDFVHGKTGEAEKRFQVLKNLEDSLLNIREIPFHAMLEVEVEALSGVKDQLIYAHENSNFNFPNLGGGNVNVMAWTHPIVQLGMSLSLNEDYDISARGYTLKSVKPKARAKINKISPGINGLYEPGGSVGDESHRKVRTGLNAVKLDMTKDQTVAFLSKMNGFMLVSGAPGSGKTTVAMQRIRFLYDQQDLRRDDLKGVSYTPELTKIFLANQNLIDYSINLLEDELKIPTDVVQLVDDFVHKFVEHAWKHKGAARRRKRNLPFFDQRGRKAFMGLCSALQLQKCWEEYEKQIGRRLRDTSHAQWCNDLSGTILKLSKKLLKSMKYFKSVKPSSSPTESRLSMDEVYKVVRKSYEKLRLQHKSAGSLKEFDNEFSQWLYWVYDPMAAISSYFLEESYNGKLRIKAGVGARVDEGEIYKDIELDWEKRIYGSEEEPWLAFLLRFVIPKANDQKRRFRDMPTPLDITNQSTGDQWTHIMIDEAQDLCVAEAALLSSFVHPDGALTVSADFNQVVSPVWGMEDPQAFKIGSQLKGEGQLFPFSKNMRQSKQIGLFLSRFYRNVFGEMAPFTENNALDIKNGTPLLMLGSSSDFPTRIMQRLNLMRRNELIKTIALLQINEDEKAMKQLREGLKNQGVDLAPIWEFSDNENRLITTSVERIKGLEYDACFVVGLDDIDSSALKYSINRAYVALSRPALQLTMLCEEMPRYLQNISKDYMTVIKT